MGYNSVLVVLNDRLREIENDPDFGRKVAQAINEMSMPKEYRRTHITGQTQVIACEHADTMQIVAIGGNTGRTLGYGNWQQDDEALLKAALAQVRAAKKKVSNP